MNLANKKILIVGFGKSGQAALRYCLSQGARVAVTDSREAPLLEEAIRPFQQEPVDWFLGGHDPAVFLSAELIVASPGVPWNLPPLKEVRSHGIPVVSELELALQELERMTHDARRMTLIAVTGTNGKTTTVHLIDHLLKQAGKKSLLAGNVGLPLLDCLDRLKESEFLVLEVSSYQMESTPSLKPDVACVLNITEDHLDWHGTFEEYLLAKMKLVRQTTPKGVVIYNGDDTVVQGGVEQIPSNRLMFSTKRCLKLGGWVEEGKLIVKASLREEPLVLDLSGVALKGIHNWENILAALLAVRPYISDRETLQKGLNTFEPLSHRMQTVRERGGVAYINDSKATNVGAALKALASTRGPLLWIAGGRDKGGSYAPLKEWVKKKSGKCIFWGRQGKKWERPFGIAAR